MIQEFGEPADARHDQFAPAPRKWNWLAFASFLLAVLFWIGEIDATTVHFDDRNFLLAWEGFAVYSAIVLVPYYFARRRWKQAPDEWTGGGYLKATAIILTLNTVRMIVVFALVLLYSR
jgi:hypothetical protein